MNKTATIQLRNLTIGYKGKVRPKIVAENICSDIYAGELTCLLSPFRYKNQIPASSPN